MHILLSSSSYLNTGAVLQCHRQTEKSISVTETLEERRTAEHLLQRTLTVSSPADGTAAPWRSFSQNWMKMVQETSCLKKNAADSEVWILMGSERNILPITSLCKAAHLREKKENDE